MRVTYTSGCEAVQSEHMSHFFDACRATNVDLVAEEEDGCLCHLFVLQQTLKFASRFVETFARETVDEEDDAVNDRKVVLPHASRCKYNRKKCYVLCSVIKN